eukprot:scaffold4715_cov115-Cylindrotheca_fusiformis.AAC.15
MFYLVQQAIGAYGTLVIRQDEAQHDQDEKDGCLGYLPAKLRTRFKLYHPYVPISTEHLYGITRELFPWMKQDEAILKYHLFWYNRRGNKRRWVFGRIIATSAVRSLCHNISDSKRV